LTLDKESRLPELNAAAGPFKSLARLCAAPDPKVEVDGGGEGENATVGWGDRGENV